jgi:two-component system, OmpR family, response regulator
MTTPPLNKILLVEDDPDIQLIAVMALEELGGFTVEPCGLGQEAIDKAAAVAPDLILLDVMMPGMDGPTTLLHLREIPETANVPVIFLTARSQPHEVAEYIEKGAVDVIKKPFDPANLCEEIENIWARCHG